MLGILVLVAIYAVLRPLHSPWSFCMHHCESILFLSLHFLLNILILTPWSFYHHCPSRYSLIHPSSTREHAFNPVFHVFMIEPATPNPFPGWNSVPDPPVIIDGELEYEISSILDSKLDKRRKCKLQYLVQWTGYEGTDEENSWLLASELPHASELISDFHQAYPDKPGPWSAS